MQLHSLATMLQKRMDRKEFLRTIALAALALVGLGFLIKQPQAATQAGAAQPAQQTNDTYGTKQ